ncbi:uncharacterized protein [Dysidea avara]|uniref:uncharacterized protein n=1 Tax=Dysidea avara TaxID=196820 RepID=UPI00333262B4
MASGEDIQLEVEVATAKPVVDGDVPIVLVTGATGYVATHTIQQLLISGSYRVRGTVRSLKNEEKVKSLQELIPDAKYPLELCEATLQDKECWVNAVKGCKYVLHIASPVPTGVPKNPDEVIRPAVDGTINVLSACAGSGSVKRVVVTSSLASVSCGFIGHPQRQDHTYTEEDWSPPEACPPYERGKTLAEKAAWDFVKDLPEEKKFELSVICPGAVIGPILTKSSAGTSVGYIKAMLAGEVPGCIDLAVPIIDVRDVARAHIVAMENPECNGKRYLLVSESNVLFQTLCQMVNKEFGPQGYKAGTMKIPKFVAWVMSKFSGEMSLIYPGIGKRLTYVNDRMVNVLGIQPRDTEQSVIETGYSLIEFGLVKKTPKYYGPGGKPEAKQGDDKEGGKQPAAEVPPTGGQTKDISETTTEQSKEETTEQSSSPDEQPKTDETKVGEIQTTDDQAKSEDKQETVVKSQSPDEQTETGDKTEVTDETPKPEDESEPLDESKPQEDS